MINVKNKHFLKQKNLPETKDLFVRKNIVLDMQTFASYSSELVLIAGQNKYAKALLTRIRNESTTVGECYEVVKAAGFLLAVQAVNLFLTPLQVNVVTPLNALYKGIAFDEERVKIVGILEGSGPMEDGVREAFWMLGFNNIPTFHIMFDKRKACQSGILKLPKKFDDNDIVIIVDDVISTGITMDYALKEVTNRGRPLIIVLALIISPRIDRLLQKYEKLKILALEFDPIIDENGFLKPGVGDMDARTFGPLQRGNLERSDIM
jgi:uracil phosphoribosyltransferase